MIANTFGKWIKRLNQVVRDFIAQYTNWFQEKVESLKTEYSEAEEQAIAEGYAEIAAKREQEDLELERNWLAETCARCSHPRDDHTQWGYDYCLECSEVTC